MQALGSGPHILSEEKRRSKLASPIAEVESNEEHNAMTVNTEVLRPFVPKQQKSLTAWRQKNARFSLLHNNFGRHYPIINHFSCLVYFIFSIGEICDEFWACFFLQPLASSEG